MSEFQRAQRVIISGLEEGLHPGVQVHVSLRGEPVWSEGYGDALPGRPMRPDTVLPWQSTTKPFTAVALAQLREKGLLSWEDKVALHLPEFGKGGKEVLSIGHLLTHTAGFRAAGIGEPGTGWKDTIRGICESRLEPGWEPGQTAGYQISSSWFILAEIVERLSGESISDYLRNWIFLPLGMEDCHLGMSFQEYTLLEDRIGGLWDTAGKQPQLLEYHSPAHCAWPNPGSNGRGPFTQMAHLYEALMGGGEREGIRLLNPETVSEMTKRRRQGLYDKTFQHVVDFGLGFLVNSNCYGAETVPYGFGRHASSATFGHGGMQSSVALADPAHDLVITACFNGMPGEQRHQSRVREFLSALYEDLEL